MCCKDKQLFANVMHLWTKIVVLAKKEVCFFVLCSTFRNQKTTRTTDDIWRRIADSLTAINFELDVVKLLVWRRQTFYGRGISLDKAQCLSVPGVSWGLISISPRA